MNKFIMSFKKLDKYATTPTRGSEHAAGYDLYSIEDCAINAGETVKVRTGIAVEIPEGYFGGIFARSGLATNRGLRPANCVGVVDSDYRGEVIVALHNDTDHTEGVHIGDRIAQRIVMPYIDANLEEVDDLHETDRGNGGFGSTGE